MKADRRAAREEEIAKAAYGLLEERGYEGVSMLAIAKRAKASNETLYRWYGDKAGLFRALVARNAAEVTETLTRALSQDAPISETLEQFGTQLLTLLLGDRAVALNRAAAADPGGTLGAALSEQGRETVLPLLCAVLENARDAGQISFADTGETAELYLALLIGDRQIRRIIGRMPQPTTTEIERDARKAQNNFLRLTKQAPSRA